LFILGRMLRREPTRLDVVVYNLETRTHCAGASAYVRASVVPLAVIRARAVPTALPL